MTSPDICPFCASPKVLPGRVLSQRGPTGFKPDGTKGGFVFTLRDPFAFVFGPAAHYCAACGMVWSQANPKDAAKFFDKFVRDDLKAWLAELDASAPAPKAVPPRLQHPAQ